MAVTLDQEIVTCGGAQIVARCPSGTTTIPLHTVFEVVFSEYTWANRPATAPKDASYEVSIRYGPRGGPRDLWSRLLASPDRTWYFARSQAQAVAELYRLIRNGR